MSTVFAYAERLAAEQAPRSAPVLLGIRWGFGIPSRPGELAEHSLPTHPLPFSEVLARRGGLSLGLHRAGLDEHLQSGRAAIVAVDCFHLPYRPACGRVHASRTLLVRPGPSPGVVRVEDGWLPAYQGPLARSDLERARYSRVELDVRREPVFAGSPVAGEWLSVEVGPGTVGDPVSWAASMLRELYAEMVYPDGDPARFGLMALEEFLDRLGPRLADRAEGDGGEPSSRRAAALLLRVELSARVYLCAFLRMAASCLGDLDLASAIPLYRQALGELQSAVDLLVKSLTHPRADEIGRGAAARLSRWLEGERRLVAALRPYASHSP